MLAVNKVSIFIISRDFADGLVDRKRENVIYSLSERKSKLRTFGCLSRGALPG